MSWEQNEIVNKTYQIKEKLGEGWAGEVYSATLLNSRYGLSKGTMIAIKKYKRHIYNSDSNIGIRIEKEANTGMNCRHINLVSILNLEKCSKNETHYLIMEYCSNKTLVSFLAQNEINDVDLINYCFQLCSGLKTLHESGIVHRDIKPQNILVDGNKNLKIADFGVVKHKDDITITESNLFLGTIRYSAPEYLINGDCSVESDIFSLGTVFYYLLYKKDVYFDQNRFTNLVLSINAHLLKFPSDENRFNKRKINSFILLETISLRMLSKNPINRLGLDRVLEIIKSRDFCLCRKRACDILSNIIIENRLAFNRNKFFVFASYVSPIIVNLMNEDELSIFLLNPTKELILSSPKLSDAISFIPKADQYSRCDLLERKRILDSLNIDEYHFINQGLEKLDRLNKAHELRRLYSNYFNVENDELLMKEISNKIKNLDNFANN